MKTLPSKFNFLFGGLLFLAILLMNCGYNHDIYAHTSKIFGNITLEVGWLNEPPLAGDLNSVILQVQKGPEENLKPVFNALANTNLSIKYGTLTKDMDFVPSEIGNGVYESKIIPTRPGSSYSITITGDISGQKINTEIPLDNIENKQVFLFPDDTLASSAPSSGPLSSTIQAVLSQLSSNIQSTQGGLDLIGKDLQSTKSEISNFDSNLNKIYFITLGSIGIGLAGLVIAALSLSRRTKIS